MEIASKRWQGFLLLSCTSTFGFLILVNHFILFRFFNSNDEYSCYFLAKLLTQGRLWATPPPMVEFFRTALIGDVGGKWFSVYPPGWPLLWAIGMCLHIPHMINPLLLVCGMYFLFQWAALILDRKLVAYAWPLLLVSPFWMFTGAAYFSHNAAFFFIALFLYASWFWIEREKVGAGALAGFAVGAGLGTRYLTVLAMTAPVGIYYLSQLLQKHKKWDRGATFFCSIAAILIAFQLYYNYLISGHFLNPPNHYSHSSERLGFMQDYTPWNALEYLGRRIFFLMEWTPPGIIICSLLALVTRVSSVWEKILRSSMILLPISYFFYYSWGGNQYGPRYYFEAYPLMVFLALLFLKKLVRRPKIQECLVIIIFIAGIFIFVQQARIVRNATEERRAVYDKIETATKKPALVFLNGFLGNRWVLAPEDSLRNEPFLNGPVIYAADRGKANKNLCALFPNRHFYKAFYDRKRNRAELLPYDSQT